MSNGNSGSSNKGVMTQKGRDALNRFKMESANELGVDLSQGYNGDLTSREAGSIGGRMVYLMVSEQQFTYHRNSVRKLGHGYDLKYIVGIGI